MISEKYITSTFYRILVDNKPVYVGYTNRSVKQRFKEHLVDKEFDSDNVTVEQIDKLEFEFTWDYQKILEYSDIVSQRETELIIEQNTKNSIYQKGLHRKIGGTTWTNVKWFVKTNKDNPKYQGLAESEILELIEQYAIDKQYLRDFVSNMIDSDKQYLKNFVLTMINSDKLYLKHFVSTMINSDKLYLKGFVSRIVDPNKLYLTAFVTRMVDSDKQYLKSFISNMIASDKQYLTAFITRMADSNKRYLKDFVSKMIDSDKLYLKNFVSNMIDSDKLYLKNFVSNMIKHSSSQQ